MPFKLSEEEKAFLKHISKILTERQKRILKEKVLGLRTKESAFIEGTSIRTIQRELKKIKKLCRKSPETAPVYRRSSIYAKRG